MHSGGGAALVDAALVDAVLVDVVLAEAADVRLAEEATDGSPGWWWRWR
jgi:hypothetical protein